MLGFGFAPETRARLQGGTNSGRWGSPVKPQHLRQHWCFWAAGRVDGWFVHAIYSHTYRPMASDPCLPQLQPRCGLRGVRMVASAPQGSPQSPARQQRRWRQSAACHTLGAPKATTSPSSAGINVPTPQAGTWACNEYEAHGPGYQCVPGAANNAATALESPANAVHAGRWDQGHPFSHGPSSKDTQSSPYGCPATSVLPHPPGHVQHHTSTLPRPAGHLYPITFILLRPSGHLHPITSILLCPLRRLYPIAPILPRPRGPRTAPPRRQEVFAWLCITVWCIRGRDPADRPR